MELVFRKHMLKAYKYLFYKLYCWSKSVNRRNKSPELSSYFSVTILVFVNLASVFLISNIIFNFQLRHVNLNKLELGLIFLIPAIPQYLLLIHNNKHLRIIKEFESEDVANKRTRNFYILLYIISTMLVFFGLLFVQMNLNQTRL